MVNKVQMEIDGIPLLIDSLDNIAANKIATLVSRFEWRDIIDIATIKLSTELLDHSNFKSIYSKAVGREKLLEDIAFFNGVCIEVVKNSQKIHDLAKSVLVRNISPEDIEKAFTELAEDSLMLLDQTIYIPDRGDAPCP